MWHDGSLQSLEFLDEIRYLVRADLNAFVHRSIVTIQSICPDDTYPVPLI